MKILYIARNTLYSSPGGDTIQIISTANHLKELGVQVDICLSTDNINYDDYSLMHFFNIIRPDDIIPHITKSSLPFVVSTIFVDYSEYEKKNRKGIWRILNSVLTSDQIEYIKTIGRFVLNGDKINSSFYLLNGQKRSVKYVAQKASLLLPNSDSEYHRMVESYGVDTKYRKIPNAIDLELFNDSVTAQDDFKDHVLCVGRIEGRKNQLNLINAVAGTGLKLTLIGKPSPNHLKYYDLCRELAAQNNNVRIIEHVNHKELPGIFKAAKVHVLPSWFETTGLSSLEAGIMDNNIVVTDKGDTKEYFEDMAFYCDPISVISIKEAVLKAFNSKVDPALKKHIRDNFTWKKAAEETLLAYEEVLGIELLNKRVSI